MSANKTKLEDYLYFLKKSTEDRERTRNITIESFDNKYQMFDKEKFIQKNKFLYSFKKYSHKLLFLSIIAILFAGILSYFGSQSSNKELFNLGVSLVSIFIFTIFLNMFIEANLIKIAKEWIDKEWEYYTGLTSKKIFLDKESSSANYFICCVNDNIFSQLSNKPEEEQKIILQEVMRLEKIK